MTAAMHRYPCAAGLRALLAILLCAPPAVGEPVVTLTDHGDPRALIDVVILGDGFTAEQMDTFHAKARAVRDGFLADPPLSNYAAFVNFHAIEVTSAESGADHPGRPKDTALGAGYNCAGIRRLICVNGGLVERVLNRSVDAAARDVILILVNDRQYGGSGGVYSVSYTGGSMLSVMLHEFGHSFAGLADEYVERAGRRCTGNEPSNRNVTFETERAEIKWNAGAGPPRGWIEPGTALPTVDRNSGVGLYEGAHGCSYGAYRPTYLSRMRGLHSGWGQVNAEAIVKTLHRRASAIAAVTPKTDTRSWVAAGSRTFAATLVRPAPDTLSVEWRLNGTPVGTADSVSIDFEAAGVGDHVLELVVADTTAKVRNDPGGLLRHTRSWRFEIDVDADADGMADGWEQRHGLSADDAADADADADGDGLANLQEFLAGTNPTVVDTDRDGVGDGREVSEGADPAVADPWVTGFTLVAVDADGNGRDIGPLADAATVDLASVDGRVNIRADIAAGHASVAVGRVEFDLTGPHTATRREGLRPHALFGAAGGSYSGGWLPNGEYTLTARSYGRQRSLQVVSSLTVRFTVTGDFEASEPAVAGFTLVDAAGSADAEMGRVVDGSGLDVSAARGLVNIRADVPANRRDVGSVRLELGGTLASSRTEDERPFALFGDKGGNLAVGWLANGTYTLTATPWTERGAQGAARAATTVGFTVTGGLPVDAPPVLGFTLVDARGGAPDPDLGPIVDGGTVDIGPAAGQVNIRADLGNPTGIAGVRLELTGPVSVTRLEHTYHRPLSLFGDDGGGGDYDFGWLPNGAYTLKATPYTQEGGRGDELPARTVSFTVTGGLPVDTPPVWGFTLVDARGGAPDPDLGPIVDGGTVDVGPAEGRVSIRADLADFKGIGSVRLELTGRMAVTRVEHTDGLPLSLFADDGGRDYNAGWLADGAYTLTATPYSGQRAEGDAFETLTVSFTVTGNPESPVKGFMLVDARGGAPEPDLGLIADGATLDLAGVDGRVNVRAVMAAPTPDVGSVHFDLRGPYSNSRTENAGGPYTLFGDRGGDYYERELLEGSYTLMAAPYQGRGRRGRTYAPRVVAFTVTGSRPADASLVTGFTLVDARGGAPDPDLGVIADGAAVDVSAVDGQVNIRADVVNSERVRSMRLELTGPVSASRLENGPAPYALFGDSGRGDYYAERLVAGAYRLQATPYSGRDGGGAARRAHEVSFTIPYVPPTATIVADAAQVSEGAVASFTVTLDRTPERTLTVAVTVVESGDALSGVPPRAVTFEPDRARATLAVGTDDDAVVVDVASMVTATLTAGAAYEVGTRATATVTVMDDDAAVFAVTAAPDLIEEGGTATVTLAITNGVTFAAERTVSLSVSGLAAGSYTLEPATAVLAAGATSLAAAFTALEDGEEDVPRTARVEAVVDTSVVGTELTVEDVGPAPRIVGVPQVGAVLEVAVEGAGPAASQWLRDGASIVGAAAREYAPVEADVGAALAVRVMARGRERTSAATVPVWPAPANPPLAAAEEELLGTTLTLGSRTFGVGVAGFSRLPGREFGSVEDAAFALGERELTLFMVNKWGNLGLATMPPVADAAGLTAYWNEYGIGSLRAAEVDETPVWTGRTPQPPEEFERYVTGASDGVRVAVSIRGPLPAATLSALSGTVPEGSAATFEVALDRAAWSARTVSLTVTQDGAVLSEAAPVSVAFAAGESRATVMLATVDDAVIEGDGAVTVTLVAGDGYVLGEDTSAAVTVTDDDVAVFAVSAAAEELDEGGATTLTVAIANGKTFAADQSIALSVSGSASASDYRLAPATLALPVGETSASATLTAVRDVAAEPAETVTVTVRHAGSVVGSATLTIRANAAPPPPVATVSAVSGTVTEGAPLTFEVALDAAALQPLRVAATVSETRAVLSGAAPAAVEFAVGERTRALVLATSDDAVVETDSTVTVALGPGDGYLLGSEASSSATVLDDDAAIFEVSASPEEIDEGGSATLTVSIANGVTFAADQSIALSVAGSASVADYGLAPETLALAAGAGSVEATLTAVDDADEESAETATVTATHGGTAVGSATLTIRASDIPSDDASLASLVLSDVDIGTFSPEATDYAAQVPTELSSTTVTVAANDAGAVLEIADAVGSTLGETRTVRLEEGGNAITVTVTAEDGATTRTYRVAVTRAYAAAWGERLPERDIDLGAGAGPTGLWSDGATLWVVWDWRSGAVRAYDLDDGSLLAERGFELAGGSGFPSGLWSDGTTLWVSDFYGGVTAHRLSDGARLPAEDWTETSWRRRGTRGRPGCGRTVRRCGWRTIRRGRRSRTGCRTSRGWRRRRSASVATAIR